MPNTSKKLPRSSMKKKKCWQEQGRSGMKLHSAITMVKRHPVAVGMGTATGTNQGQQALNGCRNGRHFLARFRTDCRSMVGTMSNISHQEDKMTIYIFNPIDQTSAQFAHISGSMHCPGFPGQLLGPIVKALASSLLSSRVEYNLVTAACFMMSSLNMSL